MRLSNLKIIVPVVMLAAMGLSIFPIGVPTAHAAGEKCVSRAFSDADKKDSANWIDARSDGSCALGYELVTSTLSAEAQAAQAKYRASDEIGCSVGAGGVGNTLAVCVSNLVYYIMVGVFSSIAYIAAFFFDLAVQLSLNSTTYALGFLTTSWTIIRDLSNMVFIFLLIYVAIEVILTADNSQTMKTLAIVITVALLVNFSFFFTRVAIDAGNLLATQFYNAIDGHAIGSSPGSGLDSTLNQGSTNATNALSGFTALASAGNTKDLTASIMDGIQVQNIVNSESFKRYTDPKNTNQSSMYILISLSTIYIAVGIAFGILAGAFLYAGAKFILRIVGLWMVIIFSPLALASAAVPRARPLFHFWLKQLVNFSFYPAAFLFMFFVLSRFMKELNAGGNFLSGVFGASSATGLGDGTFGFITILSAIANVGIRLGFVVAMMYLALSAADMLAKIRGDITTPWARTGAGWLGNMITGGGLAWAGQKTLGRIPALSGRTFDIRNAPIVKQAITPLLKKYEPMTKTPHGTFGAVPINWGEPTSTKDMAKAATEASKERDRKKREDEFHALLKKAAEKPDSLTAVEIDRLNKPEKKEIANANQDHLVKAAKVLTEETFKKMMDKEDFTKKDEFHKAWHEEAKDSPLSKADKMVDELEKINQRLAMPIPVITDLKKSGARVSKAVIDPIKDHLEDLQKEAIDRHTVAINVKSANPADPAAGRELAGAQAELKNATRAFEKAKSLAEAVAKVPLGVGDEADAGAFKKK